MSVESTVAAMTGQESASPYRERFWAGAILYPRMLVMVVDAPASPLGVPQGRRSVESRKTSLDKPPWKDLPVHEGAIESVFVRPAYLGESIAPFRVLSAAEAVIPYDGTRLMDGDSERIDRYSGLAAWWRSAEDIWLQHRSSGKRTLIEQVDYMKQLSAQFPIAPWRVVYTASGNTLAAAVVEDHLGVVEHKLYWAPVAERGEALYLSAVLNAPSLNALIRPYQSVGAFGAHDFDKYVWQAPIPAFNSDDPIHQELVGLAVRAGSVAASVELSETQSFQVARRLVRERLVAEGVSPSLDQTVERLLAAAAPS